MTLMDKFMKWLAATPPPPPPAPKRRKRLPVSKRKPKCGVCA